MKKPKIAIGVLTGAFAVLLGYEFYSLAFLDGETLSEGVWWIVDHTPLILLPIGALIGHWFWYRNKNKNSGDKK